MRPATARVAIRAADRRIRIEGRAPGDALGPAPVNEGLAERGGCGMFTP